MVLPGITLFFQILSFILATWVLIHLVAIFGFFIAVGYPIWFLFFPKKTHCVFCAGKPEGDWCPFCRRRIAKSNIAPKSFFSVCANAFLVLLFSLLSLGAVFLESRVLLYFGFTLVPKTVSFVIPAKGQYRLGEIFPMKIDIVGIKRPINAVQADISFNPNRLEGVEVSTADSFANIFIQKEINNEVGFVRLTGGLPSPGFFADHGIFGTIYFKGKSPGVVKVEFLPSSMVLANNGRGTNVLKSLSSASYLILPEKVSPTEEKQQEVIMGAIILGKKTKEGEEEQAQMTFFEESRVLSDGTEAEIEKAKEKKESFAFWDFAFDLLSKIDRFILSWWQPKAWKK